MFDVKVPDELMRVQLPPLTLQPFVENAVIHGYQKKINPFVIRLRVGLIDGGTELEARIEDNGVGISPEKLELLRRHAGGANLEQAHLGIWNVQRRLGLICGPDRVSIGFANREEGGLAVTVRFPAALPAMPDRM